MYRRSDPIADCRINSIAPDVDRCSSRGRPNRQRHRGSQAPRYGERQHTAVLFHPTLPPVEMQTVYFLYLQSETVWRDYSPGAHRNERQPTGLG